MAHGTPAPPTRDYHTRPTDKIEPMPTVGRIVHYWPVQLELLRKKGQPYPAMITHVWSENCVNLAIADDASFPLEGDPYQTSVERCDVTDGNRDDRLGKWSWPPRV